MYTEYKLSVTVRNLTAGSVRKKFGHKIFGQITKCNHYFDAGTIRSEKTTPGHPEVASI